MAIYFLAICILFTRCFIYLNDQKSKYGNCTREKPCKYLSSAFNISYLNSTEIQICENSISSDQIQIFVNLIYFCAKFKVKLFGLNQSISLMNFTLNFNQSHSLFLKNFTFADVQSAMIQSNDSKIYLSHITFSHFKTQIMIFRKSDVKLKSCLFINNIVRNFSMLTTDESNINFTNCSFNSISQFPLSFNPIINFNYSQSFFISCHFIGNYINNVFFQSNKSKLTFLDCNFYRNGGNFYLKSINQSISLFNGCNFVENSCLLFNIIDSKFLVTNTSITHNCASDSFCVLNNSYSIINNSHFTYNSCGPIVNSSNSEIEITESFFSNNISPSDLLSISSSNLSIKSSNWINSTTAYGSSISAFMTIFTISNSTFNSSHSRTCGASIFAQKSKFESISNLFLNSKSLTKGLSICFVDCQQSPFKIEQSSFFNSQKEKDFSIYNDHCSGTITNSFFNRTIEDEIPISLHDKCFNCSFIDVIEEKKPIRVTNYAGIVSSLENNYNYKIKILVIIVIIMIITFAFCFKRDLQMLFRIGRKHDN